LYKVIKKLKDFDLVEVFPKTGRMHQIRVHLSYLGHPVAGDQKYARKEFRNLSQAGRQMLHASEIKFNLNGRDYLFKASEPADFKAFLNHTVLTKSQ
jgi:23S rRNA pseudouridine1911/1915/1917 synthase